jgi:2-C-methyl-D-erythritol 2,4-cyclodiphosphate synthase
VAELHLRRSAAARAPGPTPIRVGQGFDVHRFSDDPDRALVLGGVRFAGSRGLAGHSDADAIAHAVTDALLGAAGLGDIGQLFPDTDPAWRGADSMGLLAEAVRQVRAAGWVAGNVDCTVVLEAPKLAPRKAEIEARLTTVVGGPVSVKGKRAEELGALGRREGIACFAVAILFEAPADPAEPSGPRS